MMSINREDVMYADFKCEKEEKYLNGNNINYSSLKSSIENSKPKLYKARFFMLFLYCLCTMLNGFQWIQFSVLASVLSRYYHVSIETINWTSILFMAMYIPFVFPVMWLMQNKGLKFVLVIAAAGNTLSACVQCFSLPADKFYIALISQTMASIAQTFSISIPPFISAIWFGSEEVSRACAIGVFSNQLGVGFGFLIGPLLMPPDSHDVKHVRLGLSNLAVGQVILNFLVFLGIIAFLKDKPPTPPSVAEAAKPAVTDSLSKTLKTLFKDVNFSLFVVAYGILNAVSAAIGTMLNQMVVKTFPGKELAAGQMGMLNQIAGMFGSLFFGYVLDKTHWFRFTTLGIYFACLLTMISYTVIASMKILWLHYVMFSLLGFFAIGYLSVGYEFGVEISYPVPEGTSGSVLCTSYQLIGIASTMIGSWLEQSHNALSSNLFFCASVVFGFFISIFVKCDQKRRKQTMNISSPLTAAV